MLAAFSANFIFGFSFLFSKTALQFAHPLIVLSARFTVAFLAMTVLILFRLVRVDYRGKPLGKLVLMAVAQPFAYFIFELYGIDKTSSALSGLIISLVPIGVMLMSGLVLGEKPTAWQVVCTAVSVCGVAAVSLLATDGSPNQTLGILLLVGAVICAAAFNLLSRGESVRFSPFERTYFMFAVGTVGFNLTALTVLRGQWLGAWQTAICEPKFLLAVVYLAVVSSVVAFLLYNMATSRIPVVQSASFSNITTVVSVLAGVVLLGEPFSPVQFLLCIPIILGVWGVNAGNPFKK